MSNKRIGCENFGKFYTEGKVRNPASGAVSRTRSMITAAGCTS